MGTAGTGKAGMSRVSTEALGRLLHHDAGRDGPRRRTRRDLLVALVAVLVVLGGWGLWTWVG